MCLRLFTAYLWVRNALNGCCELLAVETDHMSLVSFFLLEFIGWSGRIRFFFSHSTNEFPEETCILNSVIELHGGYPVLSVRGSELVSKLVF